MRTFRRARLRCSTSGKAGINFCQTKREINTLNEFKDALKWASWNHAMADSNQQSEQEKGDLEALKRMATQNGDAWKAAYNAESELAYANMGCTSLPFPEVE